MSNRTGAGGRRAIVAALLAVALPAAAAAASGADGGTALPAWLDWESFGVKDGLPDKEVFAVRIDGDRVWAGTRHGLALYENGSWRAFGVADGLPNAVILSLDVSPITGDLWVGTMGGLARISGGRVDAFTQVSSGLPNDFVHGVRCDPEENVIWAATAMGAGRLDLRTGAWSIFNHTNTPMNEPWTYAMGIGDGLVYIGAWGAGVLELTKATGTWRSYRDPDKEFEIDLLPDDGPVSDVTSSVDYAEGILWATTYTGLGRYADRAWRSYFAEDSGLASNFINFVRARGRTALLATDQGLSVTDGDRWVDYRRLDDGRGEIRWLEGSRLVGRQVTKTGLADNYILGVDADDRGVWVATSRGISHGFRQAAGIPASGRAAAAPEPRPGAAAAPAAPFRYAETPDALRPYRERVPYKSFFTERTQFRGAGREDPDPAGLTEVRLGFIGPLTDEDKPVRSPGARSAVRGGPKAAYGRRMLRAATLAVEEANARGGYRGLPFRIIPRTDLVLWGQTSNELARFVFEDDVWAVLSSIDSNHNHVLSRASLKAEIPVVSAGSTDPTLVEHMIPWLVRCIDDDRQLSYKLLHEVFVARRLERVAMLRVNDRDGRVGVGEFVDGARRLGHPIVIEQRFDAGQTDFSDSVAKIRQSGADAVVLWGDAEETGLAVRQIRQAGLQVPLFGYDRMAQPAFLKAAGDAAEGIVLSVTMNPDSVDPVWTSFRQRYRARWDEDPDTFAAHAYDGMNLILSAIRQAGLNRARVRDQLFALQTYKGASGDIVFDTNMSNVAPTWLATVQQGRFHFAPAPDWEQTSASAAPAGATRYRP